MAIIGFAAGAAFLQTRATLPAAPVISLAAVLLIAWLAVWRVTLQHRLPADGTIRQRVSRGLHGLLLGAAVGFYWAAWVAQAALSSQLASADEGRDFTVIGTIDNLPYRFAQGVRFNFAVEQVLDTRNATSKPVPVSAPKSRPVSPVPPRIALSWYAGFRDQVTEIGNVQPGERWQLTVRLQRPHGNANEYVRVSW